MLPTEFKINQNIIIKLSKWSKWSNLNKIKKIINEKENIHHLTLIEADPEKPNTRKKFHTVEINGKEFDSDYIKLETKYKIVNDDKITENKESSKEIDFIPVLSLSIKKIDSYNWESYDFPEIQCFA